MALQMRAFCEGCEQDLPSDGEAYICSFECTFCYECTSEHKGVCPNCSGELVNRPRRKAGT